MGEEEKRAAALRGARAPGGGTPWDPVVTLLTRTVVRCSGADLMRASDAKNGRNDNRLDCARKNYVRINWAFNLSHLYCGLLRVAARWLRAVCIYVQGKCEGKSCYLHTVKSLDYVLKK